MKEFCWLRLDIVVDSGAAALLACCGVSQEALCFRGPACVCHTVYSAYA
jgi:hypothetical protein